MNWSERYSQYNQKFHDSLKNLPNIFDEDQLHRHLRISHKFNIDDWISDKGYEDDEKLELLSDTHDNLHNHGNAYEEYDEPVEEGHIRGIHGNHWHE